MPRSRKRQGHHPHKKTSSIPAKQRVKGRNLLALLFAIFAVVIAYFAAGDNVIILLIAAVAGALIGYIVGINMEQDASKSN